MKLFARLIIWISPVVFFLAAAVYDLNPSGVRQVTYNFDQESAQISRLYPANRLAEATAAGQKLLKEPVYFRLRYPQSYEQAVIDLRYQNQGQALVQLGLQINNADGWNYWLHPVENTSFDSLAWPKVESGQMTLWQRQPKFASVNDFLANYYDLPVGAYNFNLLRRYYQNDYTAATATTTIDRLIRGSWTAYTYIKKEPLVWRLSVVDFNRTVGADSAVLQLKDWSGQVVKQWNFPDDGQLGNHVGASQTRLLEVMVPDLPEGVYTLDWQCVNNDLFVTRIETRQHLVALVNHLYLANNQEYRDGLPNLDLTTTTVFTTARSLGLSTAHPSGLQTVTVNDTAYDLEAIQEPLFVGLTDTLSKINMPKADIMLSGDGLFFFDRSQYFNPEVQSLKSFDPGQNVDYIIADYQSPKLESDGTRSATVSFDLANAAVEQRALRFMISAPHYQEQGNEIIIRSITATLYKKPLVSFGEIVAALIKEIYALAQI